MSKLPLLLGHRGTRTSASLPENTLSSFDAALKHGCDGFEFDVRRKQCGTAVVCHNSKIGQLEVALASDNQLLHLPRLQEVLRHHAQHAFLNIELKVHGLESEVLVSLSSFPPQKGFVVSSFFREVLQELRLRSEAIPLGLVCNHPDQVPLGRDLAVQYVMLHYSLARKDLLREIASDGKKSFVWTVNDRDSMLRFADWGVDGIISDETELMARTFGRSRLADLAHVPWMAQVSSCS